ncbi:MAG: amidohydrolase family protein [Syntrophales bacterium]
MDVKAIDGHRHIVVQAAAAAAGKLDKTKSVNIYPSGVNERSEEVNRAKGGVWDHKMADMEENLADLKAAGMDMGVLQPTQTMFFYWAEPAAAAELARMVNEFTAAEVRKRPESWVGLATVPLQDTDRAVRELEYAVKKLGLRGVVMGSNVNGRSFDDEAFLPYFAKVEELGVPIFIHPNNPAGLERVRNYYLANFLGLPLESTITAAHLVFSGILDRFPKLKVCLSHAGGVLPFLVGRLEHGQAERPEARELCKHPFSYYLKNFYVDTITFRPDTLRFVLELMPPGHVFLGTDYPYDMADIDPVGAVKAAVKDKAHWPPILGGNLAAVLGL